MIDQIEGPKVDPKKLIKILKFSFAGKRKKIKNSIFSTLKISGQEASDIAKKCGFSLDDRPEDLSIDSWMKLTELLEI
jgi:16S rRNA A1518/A1519 N6-dimethyltransferase RsmA/KsgA/DIM1 with predicted DNA glycosylase/AP lyase activity